MTPKWPYKLNDLFGVTLSDKPDSSGDSPYVRWEREMCRKIHNLTDEDICEALELGADLQKGARYGKPTISEIRMWIFMLFNKRQAGRSASGFVGNTAEIVVGPDCDSVIMQEIPIASLRNMIRTAATDEEIFEIVCMPRDSGQCHALEEYAVMTRPDYKRPRAADMTPVRKSVKATEWKP